jgi:hypothetical protein
MRFHHLARRIFLAPALGLALAATMTACSSGSSSTTPATTSSTPAASSTAPTAGTSSSASGSGGSAATVATITTNWQTFFNASTPTAKRVSLLQNGQKYAAEIQAMSGGLAATASAKVDSVTVTSPTQATVKYDILISGTPALAGQTGVAVLSNGTWQVGDASFCALLGLANNGKAPSVCSSAG